MPILKRIFSRFGTPILGLLLLVAGVALWAMFTFVPLSVFLLLQRIVSWTSGHPWRQAICSIALGVIGFALYQFRSRNRILYGAFEIIVAIGGFWYALGTTANLQGAAAAIIASLYVFVRGLDNYKVGITDQHRRMGLDDQHRPLTGLPTSNEA